MLFPKSFPIGHGRVVTCLALVFANIASPSWGDERPRDSTRRCVIAELFVMKDSVPNQKAREDLEKRTGIQLKVSDVGSDQEALKRLHAVSKKNGVVAKAPTLHVLNRIVVGYDSPETTGRQYDMALTVEIFTRPTCARCAAAKTYLQKIQGNYDGLRFHIWNVDADPEAKERWETLCRNHGVRVPGLPTFVINGELVVGYLGDASTGANVKSLLDEATSPCLMKGDETVPDSSAPADKIRSVLPRVDIDSLFSSPFVTELLHHEPGEVVAPKQKVEPRTDSSVDVPPLPASKEDSVLVPELPAESVESSETESEDYVITVPVLGPLDARKLGMPLFTILIGLVDGFNPCAMWVLLFLLSVLINLHDRAKILAIAATFVFVSGAAYFAFMAAWLNIFKLVGYRRWSEIALGLIAIVIGAINVKDFFAFHQGVTLSIPEGAKPGIYTRVRKIIAARYLIAAILGAAVLAILVNIVELLCTAGLPALYTKVLTLQRISIWGEYGYLLLYIVAYMLDDSIMVAMVVITLRQSKLQENTGRWLKLLSGVAILLFGLVMMLFPQWLE